MRERGLKQEIVNPPKPNESVVPRAGTWIETIYIVFLNRIKHLSFPVRERGLKRIYTYMQKIAAAVVPRAGTWIETSNDM